MKHFRVITQIIKSKPIAILNSYLSYQLATLFPLITGLLMMEIFNSLEKGQSDTTVWYFIAFFIAVLLGRIIAVYLYSVTAAIARFVSSSLVRLNLLKRIMEKPGAKSLNKTHGDVLNCFKADVEEIEGFIVACFNEFLSVFIFAVISLFILIRINFKITILVFSPLILIMLVVRMTGKRISKYRETNRRATGNISSTIADMFTNIQAIKAFGSEESMKENFIYLNRDREKAAMQDNIFTQLLSSIYENVLSIGTGMILIVIASSVKDESFKLGEFAVFNYFMNFISSSIQYFGNVMTRYKQMVVSIKNITNISDEVAVESLALDEPLYIKNDLPEINNREIRKEKLEELSIKNLTYLYKETNRGIKNVSFDVRRNSFTVITGRVGSGKTTLLRALLGLLNPQQGNIYWNNAQIDKLDGFFIPPRIAYSPQTPNFFSDTITENILLGKNKTVEEINNAVYLAVMEYDLENLVEGVNTTIGTNGVKLSGGQKQRLSAARMFISDAEIFVFDDISSALDVETEYQLWTRLFDREDTTCIAVSNRRAALKKADQIVLVKDGEVEDIGGLDELLEKSEEMRLIWGESTF